MNHMGGADDMSLMVQQFAANYAKKIRTIAVDNDLIEIYPASFLGEVSEDIRIF